MPLQADKRKGLLWSVVFLLPVLAAVYLLPRLAGMNWATVLVWSPSSFYYMIVLLVSGIILSYLVAITASFFPGPSGWKNDVAVIMLVSTISGIANMALILLITTSLKESNLPLSYLTFYYIITVGIYIYGRKFVQSGLIRITREIIYDTRMMLIEKIFSTSYQKFEKIDRGRVYATLNNDIATIGESANMLVMLVTSFITAAGAFIYLAMLQGWASLLTIVFILGISILYTVVSKKTNVYFEKARDAQNDFMRLINGMMDGFKEISMQERKKQEYKNDVGVVAADYKNKTSTAQFKFVYASLVGESSFILLLGAVAFGIPRIFPDIPLYSVMNFVILLLYLNGPLNTILNSVSSVMQLKVSWKRIQAFIHEIPANLDEKLPAYETGHASVQRLELKDICFGYPDNADKSNFSVGPVNLELARGEVLFIIGGNGSGKTTLAKLITGLYMPDQGEILINNKPLRHQELSEYFSTVFSPCHLFEKLYAVDTEGKSTYIEKQLKLLGLDHKVVIKNNSFSTIQLSSGQRKRLALLQCYLEDSPIYLFDEWTADQDPEYRNFFYRELIPQMKKEGKIVIAITHDDHYFGVADKILKMDMGRMEYVSSNFKIDALFAN